MNLCGVVGAGLGRGAIVFAGMALAAAAAPPAASVSTAGEQVELRCDAVYLPARSSWVRTVRIHFDERRVRGVDIDGVPVYSFNVQGTTILTALDNERIRIDMAAQTWSSDFRGLSTSQGRCER